MPADFFIDLQRRIVFSKATAVLGMAEALEHMDRLRGSPDFRPEFDQLFDFREVTQVTLSYEEIVGLARRTVFGPSSRRAFVVSGTANFGIGRVFGTYRELEGEPGVMIFKEMEAALEWLSLASAPDPTWFVRLNPGNHEMQSCVEAEPVRTRSGRRIAESPPVVARAEQVPAAEEGGA